MATQAKSLFNNLDVPLQKSIFNPIHFELPLISLTSPNDKSPDQLEQMDKESLLAIITSLQKQLAE